MSGFERDQAAVQRWCRNPDRMVDVISMVLLSIRQPWHAVGDQLADVRRNKAESRYLFGFKRAGYLYTVEHKARLYGRLRDFRAGRCDVVDLMRELMKVPGLGLAKAGFVVQLTAGAVGCMDAHNLKRFGIPASFLVIPKRVRTADQIAVTDERITAYVALCETHGGCAELWDSWCDLLAAKNPKRYASGAEVSRLHITFLTD